MIRIEDLLKLVLHRNSKIRLAQIQSFTDQRKAGVGDDGFASGQIAQKFVHARLLEENVSLLACLPKPISNELAPHLAQQLDQVRRWGSDIHKHVLALRWFSCQDLTAHDRRKDKRIAAARARRQKRRHKINVSARG